MSAPEADDSYRLVPIGSIPKSQRWAWTPEAMAKTARALLEQHEGKSVSPQELLTALDGMPEQR